MPSEDPASATTATDPDETAMTAHTSSGAAEPEGANGTAPATDETVTDQTVTDETVTDETVTDETVTDETATNPEIPSETAVEEEPTKPAHLWAVVMVFDIAVDLPTPHARVTLREVAEPHRMLVIPIGLPEGTALAHAWRGVPTPRPLTHELFSDVLTRLGATIDVVRLTGRRAGVVLAEIEISSPRGREVVSCRPTDGVTLSVRQGVPAPILVDLRLFDDDGDVDPDG
jgi:hypothetical protein